MKTSKRGYSYCCENCEFHESTCYGRESVFKEYHFDLDAETIRRGITVLKELFHPSI